MFMTQRSSSSFTLKAFSIRCPNNIKGTGHLRIMRTTSQST